MSSSSSSSRYNLRTRVSTVNPSKGDLQAAQILMSLRSSFPLEEKRSTFSSPVQYAWSDENQRWEGVPIRVQPRRACRDTPTPQQQQFWPTNTVAERVKARRAGVSEF